MQRGDDEEKKRKLKIESMFKSINCQRAESEGRLEIHRKSRKDWRKRMNLYSINDNHPREAVCKTVKLTAAKKSKSTLCNQFPRNTAQKPMQKKCFNFSTCSFSRSPIFSHISIITC